MLNAQRSVATARCSLTAHPLPTARFFYSVLPALPFFHSIAAQTTTPSLSLHCSLACSPDVALYHSSSSPDFSCRLSLFFLCWPQTLELAESIPGSFQSFQKCLGAVYHQTLAFTAYPISPADHGCTLTPSRPIVFLCQFTLEATHATQAQDLVSRAKRSSYHNPNLVICTCRTYLSSSPSFSSSRRNRPRALCLPPSCLTSNQAGCFDMASPSTWASIKESLRVRDCPTSLPALATRLRPSQRQ